MKRILLCASCLLIFAAAGVDNTTRPADPAEPGTVRISLRSLLTQYGLRYSLYFTVERVEASNALEKVIVFPAAVKDKEEFFKSLRTALPAITVSSNPSFPEVVHLRENVLDRTTSYIDQIISIQFEGTYRDLLKKLTDDSKGALAEDINQTSPGARFDGGTRVKVDVKNTSIRTVMCEALPRWSNPILWTCFVGTRDSHSVAFFKATPGTKPPSTATAPASNKGADVRSNVDDGVGTTGDD